MTRSNSIRRYLRFSALRQSVVLAVCLLVLQIAGAYLSAGIIRTDFEERLQVEMETRFLTVAAEVAANGYKAENYTGEDTEVVFFQAANPALAPDGLFDLRGMHEDDLWDTTAQELLSSDDNHWYYYVGEAGGSVLAIGLNVEKRSRLLAVVPITFFLVGLCISLIALSVGLGFGIHAQRRLNRVFHVLDLVADGKFNSRIDNISNRDDLDDLAHRINATLEQLEILFNQSRNFAANIAHDLNTPIARLRLRLENALQLEDLDQVHDSLERALVQADQTIAIFESFLRIARLEAGNLRKGFTPISLTELAQDIAQTYGPVIEDAGFEFGVDLSGTTVVDGDPVLLTQMVSNLIENVMRHTPAGTRLTIIARSNEIGIADTGPGIPEEAIQEVTKPSVRLSNERSDSGAGLGLALVQAIAEAHDAQLILGENPDCKTRGLLARVRFRG